ncbi:hypothetical protein [Rhodococcus opacus]|uniref:hypothetical protein n=1 Tax=Rhodococcus opacus TaxID=37919 RepID=UPI001C4908D8|nr:hypothetical protein [Rhodococcus opacus]MBV6758375.1 hypothetical protein [Rhodococcus opacus]
MKADADLYLLYLQDSSGVSFEMGGERAYNAKRRSFTIRAAAVNYARKHGAKVAHVHFPSDGPPVVVAVLDPKEQTE